MAPCLIPLSLLTLISISVSFPHFSFSGEDPTCSDSLLPWQLSVSDHTTYLHIDLHQPGPTAAHCDGRYNNEGPDYAMLIKA